MSSHDDVYRPPRAGNVFPLSRGTDALSVSPEEMAEIASLVYTQFGICLKPDKRSFLAARLQPLLLQGGFRTIRDYIHYLKGDPSGYALSDLANRITTSHTSFFREMPHFDFLNQTALPELAEKKAGARDLRIWSAVCATGEEPYSLSMTLHRFFGASYAQWTAGVLATDISATALGTARDGVYAPRMLKAVPEDMKSFFFPLSNGDFRVSDALRRDVTFRRFNLISPHYPFREPFDIIFCRNVMIYFDDRIRTYLLGQLYRCLAPGGFLFVGHAEALGAQYRQQFRLLCPAVYRREET